MVPYPSRAVRMGDSRKTLVMLIQTRLNDIGMGPLKDDGDFGKFTKSAVKEFQTRRGLDDDGVVGSITWSELFGLNPVPPAVAPSQLLAEAVRIARAQDGVREVGFNRGVEVERYLASVGLPPGKAYCVALDYWIFSEASKKLRLVNPVVPTGHVHTHWKKAPSITKVSPDMAADDISLVKPGMLFLIDHDNERGHQGMVVDRNVQHLITLEGNTNPAGSREGEGVYLRTRRYSEVNLGYLDYSRSAAS